MKGEARDAIKEIVSNLTKQRAGCNDTKSNPNSNASNPRWLDGYNYAKHEDINTLQEYASRWLT